ncbi:hypothetical protein GH714_041304 [Hevea brasiliensis]|uniref:VOC domain-containing protein n=1 Tax=Hevea brasiliensis TaxID=3981 RepID=A0A6A6N1H2_HEVBR|nr:hypothetical protein GH714_041304 [Hevea brasiliensis]
MAIVEKKLKDMKIEYVKGKVEEGGMHVDQLFFHDPDGFMIEICNCDVLPVIPLAGDAILSCSLINCNIQQQQKQQIQDSRADGEAAARAPRNLLAWDGSSRLYYWDSSKHCLHRISIRLGEPETTSVLAATPSKVLLANVQIDVVVNKISINRNGSALLLAGSDGLCVMYLYGRTSDNDKTIVCRTVSVGSQIYFNESNLIRTLQVAWHPYSDTHLGILSSDSVFRLFDLSSDLLQPEQEYYLQPVEPGRSRHAASICPVDFSYGGDHLWDRFSGPLQRVHGGEEDSGVRGVECEGRAVSFLYNVISKDSILVIAWSGGQLQIDALADEIQPVWTIGSPPRVRVDSHDRICALAMICELTSSEIPVAELDQPLDHTVWLSHPPPLLRLAIVDLALPRKTESGSNIMMFSDPLMPERIYSVHDGGIDSILLHFLPFTSQSSGKEEIVRAPSVHPVLSTCQADNSSPLCGFEALSDSFGYSWIIGVTSMQECFVLEMKTWNLLLPIHVDVEKKSPISEEWKEGETP